MLVGEGAGWPLVLETVLEVSGRDAEAHRVALATAGLRGGVSPRHAHIDDLHVIRARDLPVNGVRGRRSHHDAGHRAPRKGGGALGFPRLVLPRVRLHHGGVGVLADQVFRTKALRGGRVERQDSRIPPDDRVRADGAARAGRCVRGLSGSIRCRMLCARGDDGAETMEQIISNSLATRRFSMALLGVFAGLALLMSCVGIYGVLSYLIGQRTHEIGVRVALGARSSDVLRLIVRQGMTPALVGIGSGLIGAATLTLMARKPVARTILTKEMVLSMVGTFMARPPGN